MVKNPPANAGGIKDTGLIPVPERSPGGGHGNPLQYSCPEDLLTEESDGLQFIGLQRVGHDWSDLACKHIKAIPPYLLCFVLKLMIQRFLLNQYKVHKELKALSCVLCADSNLLLLNLLTGAFLSLTWDTKLLSSSSFRKASFLLFV